jgi:hypothetical protein
MQRRLQALVTYAQLRTVVVYCCAPASCRTEAARDGAEVYDQWDQERSSGIGPSEWWGRGCAFP